MDLHSSRKAADTCLGAAIRRAAREVTAHYDRTLAPAGLKSTQFTVLNAIHLMTVPTVSRLSEALVMDRTTLTRNLDVVIRNGWVARGVGREDRRERIVRLTAKGRRVLANALPYWRRAQAAVVDRLGETSVGQLRSALDRLEQVEPREP